jgi:DNA-binding LacI/PurR family transcriptional regulator
MGRGVTIIDVARHAGVSRSSVSNFLNGHLGHLGIDAQSRIRNAIKALSYEPNAAARSLKSGTLPTIGLLLPSIANPFYCEMAQAIEAAALPHSIRIMVCSTFRSPERERSFLDALGGYGIAGAITVSPMSDRSLMAEFERPCVAIDAPPGSADLVINIDNAKALALAVEHLAGLGHVNIAYAGDEGFTYARSMREQGFNAACTKLGIAGQLLDAPPPAGESLAPELSLFERGQHYARTVLANPARPTATVCLNDLLASGMLHGLKALKVDVPAQHSVMGIDDVLVARLAAPALSTIQQPIAAIGQAAVEGLVALMRHAAVDSEIVLEPALGAA